MSSLVPVTVAPVTGKVCLVCVCACEETKSATVNRCKVTISFEPSEWRVLRELLTVQYTAAAASVRVHVHVHSSPLDRRAAGAVSAGTGAVYPSKANSSSKCQLAHRKVANSLVCYRCLVAVNQVDY